MSKACVSVLLVPIDLRLTRKISHGRGWFKASKAAGVKDKANFPWRDMVMRGLLSIWEERCPSRDKNSMDGSDLTSPSWLFLWKVGFLDSHNSWNRDVTGTLSWTPSLRPRQSSCSSLRSRINSSQPGRECFIFTYRMRLCEEVHIMTLGKKCWYFSLNDSIREKF